MNRRTFIKATAFSVAALLTGCKSKNNSSLPDIKFLRQIITKDINVERCIMWQTDLPMTEPRVEIAIKGKSIGAFSAQDSSFADDKKNVNQYTAQIYGLDEKKSYEYRIIDGDAFGDWYPLKQSADDKLKVIIFPDSQCGGDYDTWGEIANNAFERNPDAEFFINVGDLVDNGEDSAQWQDWFEQIEDYTSIIPFAPVMGNHETYSRDWQTRQPIAYLNYFEPPDNEVPEFARRFYSFDCGSVHFAILDSQWEELDNFRPNLRAKEIEWLRRDMQATNKPWKVVFIHKDVLQYRINNRPDRQEGFSDVGKIFMPEFESLGVDVVFTGHLHTYRNRGRLKNFREDETGTLYILTGVCGNVRYDKLWINHALDKYVAPQPETGNYLTMSVDAKTLTVKCFLPDGKMIDETVLTKGDKLYDEYY